MANEIMERHGGIPLVIERLEEESRIPRLQLSIQSHSKTDTVEDLKVYLE